MKIDEDIFELGSSGGSVFYHPENDAVLICVVPTDNQLDGFEDFDELVKDTSSEETESWSIIMTYSTKSFLKIADNLRRLKK